MKGGQHFIFGTVTAGAGLMFAYYTSWFQLEPGAVAGAVLLTGIGSLVPDIDHPYAKISNRIPKKLITEAFRRLLLPVFLIAGFFMLAPVLAGGFPGIIKGIKTMYQLPYVHLIADTGTVIILIGLAFIVTSRFISALFGHRGATHSLLFAAGATILAIAGSALFNIAWWYGLWFGWGWVSHLIADATTGMGLPALFWPFSRK